LVAAFLEVFFLLSAIAASGRVIVAIIIPLIDFRPHRSSQRRGLNRTDESLD
jgi:hypothetical protein